MKTATGILSDPTPDMLAMSRFDDGAIDMREAAELCCI